MRDTFHLSGVSSASKAVRGVPRIKELLSVTKNIKAPAMNIYLYPEINKNKMKSKDVLNKIETTYFKDIVTSTKIYYDPDDFNTTIGEDRLFVQSYAEFIDIEKLKAQNLSPWLLRMEFDKGKMLEYQLSMIDIYHVLNDFYEDNISAMFSDDNSNKLVFRIKIHEDLEPSKEEDRDIITELKALEKNILETINIKGVRKVNKVSMSKKEFFEYNPDTMLFDKTHEWVLESNGTNLLDIMCVPHVDISRTVSNNINEIYEIFGIEAARQALYNEIYSVIKDADLYVNYRHIALLVDTMTNKGYIISIDRHGINRVDIGPLAKSSFEETTDMLIKAGIFSEVDRINGVSANIMLGQIPPCGTGDTDVLIDELKLAEQFEHVEEESEDNNDLQCDSDVLTFDFTLPEIDSNITKKIPTLKIVK
jgi:DNA-directed RNA polymerase II subunit RPB1